MKLVKLLFNAIVAWALGLAFITATLYFSNGGVDFTTTDLMGFSMLALVASGLLMLVFYLPGLYWLKRRRGGVKPRISFALLTGLVCNIPLFSTLIVMVNRKVSLSEAIGFMVTFLIIGSVFGLGFTLVHKQQQA